ncbi:MAG: potassium-transporting ATPase subunit A [Chloroflexi bacterium OLB13]|nr:MAG: potassium-transporting ATPase subunit A [Chloroflexi bacterium OLB13]
MTANGLLQIGLFLLILVVVAKPLGLYIYSVYEGRSILGRVFGPVERGLYRLFGTREDAEMNWKTYTLAVLAFSLASVILLYALQRLQGSLPLNPEHLGAVSPDSSFNTAASFVTNTNWQGYAGESTMSYLTQMLGLTVQNFVSAAVGMAVLMAFIRGFVRQTATTLGNFWVDLTRGTLYILLPMAIVVSLVIVSQGAVQNLSPYQTAQVLDEIAQGDADGASTTEQILAMGPAASQVAIKHLGTNGGGFFNANAAHPFENPTPLTDLILILAETVIATGLTYTFGKMVGDTRQGWAILTAMLIVLAVFMTGAYAAEAAGTPQLEALGADVVASDVNPGGNMEGKETRFGIARSALFATATTATSTGAVNTMHDSLTPLGGLVTLFMMQMSESVLGGVGSGLYSGMLIYAIVAVFIAGLMVGRTPEYLGKKIEAFEMKIASIIILVMPALVLGFTALAVISADGAATIYNTDPPAHGFSEVLYAFTSGANNNGSAFAGLGANTPFYNTTIGLAMLFGRFFLIVASLAIAGSLAQKKAVPASEGTLPTHTGLFIAMLIGVVIIVGALTFVPALALGPIVEHLSMIVG